TLILTSMDPIEVNQQAPREELDRILSSPLFSRNERLSRFLRFVVERHLEGRDSELKESLIAIEVFDRSTDYDPKQTSIVRTEAGRLRARLAEYYTAEGIDDSIIIELPKGGYAPVFRHVESIQPKPQPRFGRFKAKSAAIAVSLLVLGVAIGFLWLQRK